MSEDNRARFNELSKQVIDLLIGTCPLPLKITVETFNLPKGGVSSAPSGMANGFYTPSPEEDMLDSTLAWLVAEGFVRESGTNHYVATLQTLKLYGSVPNAVSA